MRSVKRNVQVWPSEVGDWEYHNSTHFLVDPQLTVRGKSQPLVKIRHLMSSSSEGSPEYPRMVRVFDETVHEGQLTGVYRKREKSNDYVHENGVFELQYRGIIIIVIIVSIKCVPGLPAGGVWCIRDNISCKLVTGWDFTSDHFVWPNTGKLYIRDFPANITIESRGRARASISRVMGRYD